MEEKLVNDCSKLILLEWAKKACSNKYVDIAQMSVITPQDEFYSQCLNESTVWIESDLDTTETLLVGINMYSTNAMWAFILTDIDLVILFDCNNETEEINDYIGEMTVDKFWEYLDAFPNLYDFTIGNESAYSTPSNKQYNTLLDKNYKRELIYQATDKLVAQVDNDFYNLLDSNQKNWCCAECEDYLFLYLCGKVFPRFVVIDEKKVIDEDFLAWKNRQGIFWTDANKEKGCFDKVLILAKQLAKELKSEYPTLFKIDLG